MAISTTKLKEIMETTEKKDDLLMKQRKAELKSFRLSTTIERVVDKGLDELLQMKPSDLVNQTWEKLQEFLVIVSNWSLYIRGEINEREVYFEFVAKREFKNLMREKKMSYSDKTETAKEEKALQTDKKLEELECKKEVSEMNFRILKGFDTEIEHWYFVLQNIIKRKEIEFRRDNLYQSNIPR